MKLLGRYELSFSKLKQLPGYALSTLDQGWRNIIHEPYTGAWQRNDPIYPDSALSHYAVYRCVTLIASDIAKMRCKLVQEDDDGIWHESDNTDPRGAVLVKPNNYQNRIQFYQQWLTSKLSEGNAYLLKERDDRKVVTDLHVLNPYRTKPMVAPDSSVFYQLSRNDLAGQGSDSLIVPASEIIHDRHCPLFHPLCGIPPLFAANMPAIQALGIQRFSEQFFRNHARPSGILTAPGEIPKVVADRIKTDWENNYSGQNIGKVAVAGSGLTWVPLVMNAVDAELIDQLKLTAEQVCSSFGVPPFKVGIGPTPAYNNIQALNQQYYSDAIQIHVESIELLQDEGLGLVPAKGTEFDLDNLLRMDAMTQTQVLVERLKGINSTNEARAIIGYGKVPGGDDVRAQQQQFSLAALAERDRDKPFSKATPAPDATSSQSAASTNNNESTDAAATARSMLWDISRQMREADA